MLKTSSLRQVYKTTPTVLLSILSPAALIALTRYSALSERLEQAGLQKTLNGCGGAARHGYVVRMTINETSLATTLVSTKL